MNEKTLKQKKSVVADVLNREFGGTIIFVSNRCVKWIPVKGKKGHYRGKETITGLGCDSPIYYKTFEEAQADRKGDDRAQSHGGFFIDVVTSEVVKFRVDERHRKAFARVNEMEYKPFHHLIKPSEEKKIFKF